MKFATFDIETIPNQSLPEGLKPEFDPESVKLGNIKDQTKINEKIAKAKMEFEEGLDKKMSLDPDLCEVIYCGIYYSETNKVIVYGQKSNDFLIKYAWEAIQKAYLAHTPLVSFNGIQFDLPVLWHSAMRLGIPVSPQMYSDLTKKYDNRYHYDLMQILAGWDRTKYKSLDFYLKLFGIGEKTGDGSQVYDWWKAKEYDKIRKYCQKDVELTGKLFEKLEGYIMKEI